MTGRPGTTPQAGDVIVITKGRHVNEPAIVIGTRGTLVAVLLGRTGEPVTVRSSSVDNHGPA